MNHHHPQRDPREVLATNLVALALMIGIVIIIAIAHDASKIVLLVTR